MSYGPDTWGAANGETVSWVVYIDLFYSTSSDTWTLGPDGHEARWWSKVLECIVYTLATPSSLLDDSSDKA